MLKYIATTVLILIVVTTPTFAADIPKKKTAQVKSGLYVTAREAYSLLQANPSAILIDVRDPIEIMFTGFTDETDIHVPYMISDPTKKNSKKPLYNMVNNENFATELEEKLLDMQATKASPLIFICRSGSTRSAPAADIFFDKGYQNTYTVVDGFEGGKLKEGKSKGVRAKDGWRNSGLPWGYELNFDKMYMTAMRETAPIIGYSSGVTKAIHTALDDEYKAHTTYAAYLKHFGDLRPFSNIIHSEARHIEALNRLLKDAAAIIPENPYKIDEIKIPTSIKEACSIAIVAEEDNAQLYYDKLLPAVQAHSEIVKVFTSLADASQQRHLKAFKRCVSRDSNVN